MDIGIAFDLKSDFAPPPPDAPEDRLEEYDSLETVDAIAAALRSAGHSPRPLGGGRRLVATLLAEPPELVFNLAEGAGTRSREAQVPALCELLGVPFTHSDPLALAVSLDKAMTKRVVASHGVPTPPFAVVEHEDDVAALRLEYPVLAKPLAEGSSIGIRNHSRADDPAALRAVLATQLRDYRQPVLVEEFCSGPEFTVGVRGQGAGARAIGVMEIVPRRAPVERFVYGLETKRNWREEVEYQAPPQRPPALVDEVAAIAVAAYRALDCRDVARCDLRVDRHGRPRFLELNPLPGLNPVTGDLVILAGRVGLGYERLIQGIVDDARARWRI